MTSLRGPMLLVALSTAVSTSFLAVPDRLDGPPALAARSAATTTSRTGVRVVRIRYAAHNGVRRNAYVVMPRWYRRGNAPALPLVISPHGRGLNGRTNVRLWADLPGRGSFLVVSPDGHGRRLARYSWGYTGQVADLAKMPTIVERALSWVNVDRKLVYAFGGSMGGQETLLLVARHPRLLAGAAAFDSVVDFKRQYRYFRRLHCNRRCRKNWAGSLGQGLQELARREVGGSPGAVPKAYASRSPLAYARRLAGVCVPLQMWWSVADRRVGNQSQAQSGKLFWELKRLNPKAPIQAFVGFWIHSAEMRASARLPLALATFGLLPPPSRPLGRLRVVPPPDPPGAC